MALDSVLAGDELRVTVSFYDETGAAIVPTSATYRVIDVESGDTILAATAMSPITASYLVTLRYADNSMHNTGRDSEIHEMVVVAIYGTDGAGNPKQKSGTYRYKVVAP